jgi:hypothetical protein
MTKAKSGKVEQYLTAISHLKAAQDDWPQGYNDPIIGDRLRHFVHDLMQELFEILIEKRKKGKNERTKNLSPEK